MKSRQWILLAALAILLIGGGYGAVAWMNRPMGQSLSLQTPSPVETEAQPTSEQAAATPETTSTLPAQIPAPTLTAAPTQVAGICGNTGSMRLLVIGLTTPTKEDVLGANAIRLVTINFDQPSAVVFTLPAMLWVNPPATADFGVEPIQLTAVYRKAYTAAKDNPEQVRAQKATQALAQTIVDNFGYTPDHYITLDEGVFIKYVDALGGVEINLPKAVDGKSEGYGFYPAGPQLLDGTRALNFARLYHPGGTSAYDVWGNQGRQNLVLKAILAATLKPQNWTKIPGLMVEIQGTAITDLSLDQTLDLVCMVKEVGKNTGMLGINKDMVTLDASGRMIPDVKAIQRLIVEMEQSN